MQSITFLYILIAIIAALLLALFQYFYKVKTTSNKLLYAVLRFLTVFTLLLLIVNPKLNKTKVFNEKPNLVICLDNSESIAHLGQDSSALNILKSLKSNSELNSKFNIDYYSFGGEFRPLDSLNFNEKQTNIADIFKNLKQVYANTIAPTILLTDGNQTYGDDFNTEASSYKQDIYSVILGDTLIYTDLRVEQINVNKYAFLKNKFPVEVRLLYSGNEKVTSKFQISSGNKIIHSQLVNFDFKNNVKTITVNLEANTVGVLVYQAKILPLNDEKNKINNIKNFAIEVIDEKTNVVIISETKHPDLGALKKAIESNKQRTAKIISPTEFLSDKSDYQLAIIYQPTSLYQSIFEKLETEGINRFIITGTHTQWSFLNRIQSNYKQEITNQTEFYQPYLNSTYSLFNVNTIDFDDFPPLESEFGKLSINVPHDILLYKSINSNKTDSPLLFTFENQNTREALLTGDGLWRWRSQTYLNDNTFENFDSFINKLVQYLSSNKRKDRLVLDYESFYQNNQDIEISAQFFNKNYEFSSNSKLDLNLINSKSKNTTTLPFILDNSSYVVSLNDLDPGTYNFTVNADNQVKRSGTFTVLEFNVEEQFLNPNLKQLQNISNTKNYLSSAGSIDNLTQDLLSNNNYQVIQKSIKKVVPLIDFKILLILLIISLTAEWFLRKYNGLI